MRSPDGDHLGYIAPHDAALFGLEVETVELSPRFLRDPFIVYHAKLAQARGLLGNGHDLNSVQLAMLASYLFSQKKEADELEEQRLLSQMMVANPALYQQFVGKDEGEPEMEGIEWRKPESLEEFKEVLGRMGSGDFQDAENGEWSDEINPEDFREGMSD